jgi:hypothetical protein
MLAKSRRWQLTRVFQQVSRLGVFAVALLNIWQESYQRGTAGLHSRSWDQSLLTEKTTYRYSAPTPVLHLR